MFKTIAITLALSIFGSFASAQTLRTATLPGEYRLVRDAVYMRDGGFEGKLDAYVRKGVQSSPVVIWWHGAGADKEYMRWLIPPLLEMGYSVVVPQAEDGPQTPDAALRTAKVRERRVVAGRCALQWLAANAEANRFDTQRVIVAGVSLGGYTALTSAMVTEKDGFDYACPGEQRLRIVGVADFFSPIQLPEGIEGDRARLDVLAYVRKGAPPVLIVHGTDDPTVPYARSEELAAALKRNDVVHHLYAVPKGKHGLGTWEPDHLQEVWRQWQLFFDERVGRKPSTSRER